MNKAPANTQPDDIDTLIWAHLHDQLDDAGCARLEAWLAASPLNADRFVREARFHQALGDELRGRASLGRIEAGKGRVLTISRSAAAIVLLVLAVTASLFFTGNRDSRTALSGAAAVWLQTPGDDPATAADGMYRIAAGLARLTFASGATAIVEGPASFDLQGTLIRLDRGRLTLVCPTRQAREVIVEVAGLRVEDLGTEFGVAAHDDGSAEVFVFQGSVIVSGDTLDADRTLRVGEGLRLSLGAVSDLDRASPFVRLAEYSAREFLIERGGADVLALLTGPDVLLWTDMSPGGDGPGDAPWGVNDLAGGATVAPAGGSVIDFVAGRHAGDRAVAFHRPESGLRVNLPGSHRQLTLSAWVRLDQPKTAADGSPEHRGLLMSDAWGSPGQVHWQGKGSGFRVSFYWQGDEEDPRFPATPEAISDGAWHMLTTVIQTTAEGCVVTHYLDGMVVSRSEARPAEMGSMPLLTLGESTIGAWMGADGRLTRQLDGAIDEMMVWSRALRPAEVSRLHEVTRR